VTVRHMKGHSMHGQTENKQNHSTLSKADIQGLYIFIASLMYYLILCLGIFFRCMIKGSQFSFQT